jgi:hypothetical protein
MGKQTVWADSEDESWFNQFSDDLRESTQAWIGTGYFDKKAAEFLLATIPVECDARILFAIHGCWHPDVVDLFSARESIQLRGTTDTNFHWKVALVTTPADRLLWIGSANFTEKGTSGRGECVLRIRDAERGVWSDLEQQYDRAFSDIAVRQGSELSKYIEEFGPSVQGGEQRTNGAKKRIKQKADKEEIPNPTSSMWLIKWERTFSEEEIALIEQSESYHEACSASEPARKNRRGKQTVSLGYGELQPGDRNRLTAGEIVLAHETADEHRSFSLGQIISMALVKPPRSRKKYQLVFMKPLFDAIEENENSGRYDDVGEAINAQGGPVAKRLDDIQKAGVFGVFEPPL